MYDMYLSNKSPPMMIENAREQQNGFAPVRNEAVCLLLQPALLPVNLHTNLELTGQHVLR